ncbi:SRPBCC family protein [Spongorhabdus nitratireducens]
MKLVDIRTVISASPAALLEELLNHEHLSRFFNARFRLLEPAEPSEPEGGKGALRQVSTRGNKFRERIVSASHQGIVYCIEGPGPLVGHQGHIQFTPRPEGTEIHYCINGESANWIPTRIVGWVISKDIKAAMKNLRRYYHAD